MGQVVVSQEMVPGLSRELLTGGLAPHYASHTKGRFDTLGFPLVAGYCRFRTRHEWYNLAHRLAPSAVLAYPTHEARFVEFTGGKPKHGERRVGLRRR